MKRSGKPSFQQLVASGIVLGAKCDRNSLRVKWMYTTVHKSRLFRKTNWQAGSLSALLSELTDKINSKKGEIKLLLGTDAASEGLNLHHAYGVFSGSTLLAGSNAIPLTITP